MPPLFFYNLYHYHTKKSGLPQCKDFSLQKAKLCGGGVNIIAYIMQFFHKFIASFFCPISLPMGVTLCKLVAEALQEIVRPEVDHVCEVEGKMY